jgi:hypothetical protein
MHHHVALGLADSPGATPAWVTTLIAAAAAILADAVTAIASAYVARRKVAEIELQNSFQLTQQYLESARNYTQAVYLPLAVAVYKLHDGFLSFRTEQPHRQEEEPRLATFTGECEHFISAARDLFGRGASAVLTLKLDETLTLFVSFLRESLTASRKKVVNQVTLEASIGSALGRSVLARTVELSSVVVPYNSLHFSFLPGLSIGFHQAPKLVATPIASKEFERQFVLYVNTIKAAIKEVTLGAHETRRM